jgi:PadR family transcriptional regulator, regulatory protein AphA
MSPRKSSPLTLEYILLGFLRKQPMHGYDLFKIVSADPGISMIWRIKRSELYALLNKLEKDGLLFSNQVQSEVYPPRREYQLTEAGQNYFTAWVKQPVLHGREVRQEFLARLYFALQDGKPAALELIKKQKAVCARWLEHMPARDHHEFVDLVQSYRASTIQSLLIWLDKCQSEIEG